MNSAPVWFFRNVVPFLLCGFVLIGGAQLLIGERDTAHTVAAAALGCILYALVAAVFVDSSVRAYIRKWLGGDARLREAPL